MMCVCFLNKINKNKTTKNTQIIIVEYSNYKKSYVRLYETEGMAIGNIAAITVVLVAVAWLHFWNSPASVNSVVVQALKYFTRPHVDRDPNFVFKPIMTATAWNGSYLKDHPELWSDNLSVEDKASLTKAVLHFQQLDKPLKEMTLTDFPLPQEFITKIEAWKDQLGPDGRGFWLIRGVPVEHWSKVQSEIFFWAFGKLLGVPGAQDKEGSLLGHVTDVGETNQTERPYRQKIDIAYHCDGADMVGLLCLHPAKTGGESQIISSVTVYNRLLSLPKGQEYARLLFGRVFLFTRKSFGVSTNMAVHPLRLDEQAVLRTFWNQNYYTKSYRHPNGSLTHFGENEPAVLEAVEAYDAILRADMRRFSSNGDVESTAAECDGGDGSCGGDGCGSPQEQLGLEMAMQRGDIQLLSNHFVLHARSEFTDYSDTELAQLTGGGDTDGGRVMATAGKRDLLRLWVSQEETKYPTRSSSIFQWVVGVMNKQRDLFVVLGNLVEAAVWYR
jgi:hypothetical protein